jgi:hypothetical protein
MRELKSNHLTKIVVVAIICSALIGSSSLAIARAATSQVISGDTENFREYQGFAPEMEPWEAEW